MTLVTPVALVRSSVAGLVMEATETVSTLAIDEGVTEPLSTAYKVSVPKPPSKRSPEFNVCRLPVLRPASNVSSPVPPVNELEPVVSVKVWAGTTGVAAATIAALAVVTVAASSVTPVNAVVAALTVPTVSPKYWATVTLLANSAADFRPAASVPV